MLLRNLSLRLANRVAHRTTTTTSTSTIAAASFTTTTSILKKYDPLPRTKDSFKVDNPNLKDLEGDDYLYHLGLNPAEDDLQRFFHDVKVCFFVFFCFLNALIELIIQFFSKTIVALFFFCSFLIYFCSISLKTTKLTSKISPPPSPPSSNVQRFFFMM